MYTQNNTHAHTQNGTYSVYKFHSALEILAGSARKWVKTDQFAAFRVALFVLSCWLTIKTELKPKWMNCFLLKVAAGLLSLRWLASNFHATWARNEPTLHWTKPFNQKPQPASKPASQHVGQKKWIASKAVPKAYAKCIATTNKGHKMGPHPPATACNSN